MPKGQNTPQVCPYKLYSEQLSGTAFTVPRSKNKRSWLYRIQPCVTQSVLKPVKEGKYSKVISDYNDKKNYVIYPSQLRWSKIPDPKEKTDFIDGIYTYAGAGSPDVKEGISIYGYTCNSSMTRKAFYNSDGDFLIVPQTGTLYITTEFGKLTVGRSEIAVIPVGVRYSVEVTETCKGWIVELYNGHFEIPDLGPIGANGLANPRDFQAPVAYYEREKESYVIINKFCSEFFEAEIDHSPFDVVAWHGNYYPYKYDLNLFNAVNTVTYDHSDPSIFTVLTVQSNEPGVANCDFVLFKSRWIVAEHSFRPPYYHRNVMSEFMGNIYGEYDAKGEGFGPGNSSLHLPFTPHGPDYESFKKATEAELKPVKYPDTMSFMFETRYMLKVARTAYNDSVEIDKGYNECWADLKDNFSKE